MRMRCIFLVLLTAVASAQQRIGSIALEDATVSGALDVTPGQAVLIGASSVTARDHAAELKLERGGMVRICQTSGLHVATGAPSASGTPLMLALDRGAIELAMPTFGSDVILTPDLRLSIKGTGPLDLRLRVAQNGDTCVEQRGTGAPTLTITDSFGESTYELHAGQHVMFEHGSLREVVDHESSPCGCPPATMSPAQVALIPGGAEHPFPAAQSVGLAAEPAIPQATPGAVHTQVAATLSYPAAGAPLAVAPPAAPPPVQKPADTPHGLAHAVGHFFRRLFGGS